jgi:hypothetical protein
VTSTATALSTSASLYTSATATSSAFKATSAASTASSKSGLVGCACSGSVLLCLGTRTILALLDFGELRNSTLSDLVDTGGNITIDLFQCKNEIGVGPVGKHVLQHAKLGGVLLLHFTKLALIFQ